MMHVTANLTPAVCMLKAAWPNNMARLVILPVIRATFGLQPMVSLVFPSVYPTKMEGCESKDWRGLWTILRFRPSFERGRHMLMYCLESTT